MSESRPASKLLLDADTFATILDERLPFAQLMGLAVDEFHDDYVTMRAVYSERFLRPGGTVAGPIMMGLADAAVYALVLSRIGPVELAVTTQLSINFLRKPEPADVVAHASMLKLGKRLAVAEVVLYSEALGIEQAVAHATATYSIPPPDRRDI
ncbi:MAG: PaaI family thioesterase [Granulosicoccus sp.]